MENDDKKTAQNSLFNFTFAQNDNQTALIVKYDSKKNPDKVLDRVAKDLEKRYKEEQYKNVFVIMIDPDELVIKVTTNDGGVDYKVNKDEELEKYIQILLQESGNLLHVLYHGPQSGENNLPELYKPSIIARVFLENRLRGDLSKLNFRNTGCNLAQRVYNFAKDFFGFLGTECSNFLGNASTTNYNVSNESTEEVIEFDGMTKEELINELENTFETIYKIVLHPDIHTYIFNNLLTKQLERYQKLSRRLSVFPNESVKFSSLSIDAVIEPTKDIENLITRAHTKYSDLLGKENAMKLLDDMSFNKLNEYSKEVYLEIKMLINDQEFEKKSYSQTILQELLITFINISIKIKSMMHENESDKIKYYRRLIISQPDLPEIVRKTLEQSLFQVQHPRVTVDGELPNSEFYISLPKEEQNKYGLEAVITTRNAALVDQYRASKYAEFGDSNLRLKENQKGLNM